MSPGLNGIQCCRREGICPHCGNDGYQVQEVYPMECSMYKLVTCTHCSDLYVIPYLIEFDEERPEDEMIVHLFAKE